MRPIIIDLSGLQRQFGLDNNATDMLTETCVQAVTAAIYSNWEALAKQRLKSTLPEYLRNLNVIDKGRFARQIVLTGVLPNMVESGASPFDIKEGFKKSPKAKTTIPVYNRKGQVVYPGGDWYLTVPFRLGTPGTVGQAGFSGEIPSLVYNVIKGKPSGQRLAKDEIPYPYDAQNIRPAIFDKQGKVVYDKYKHRHSIYEGLAKQTGQYARTTQNTYNTFRRAGANSDPLSWIHKGIQAAQLAEEAVRLTDVDTIVENEVLSYLEDVI